MLIDRLNWRYATKKMNPDKVVAEDKVERILEAVRLAPTSSGLQQFEVIVVTNKDLRAKIRAIAWDQAQVTDASHLVVFAAWDNYTADRINGMFDLVNDERGFRNEGWKPIARCCSTPIRSVTPRPISNMPRARPMWALASR